MSEVGQRAALHVESYGYDGNDKIRYVTYSTRRNVEPTSLQVHFDFGKGTTSLYRDHMGEDGRARPEAAPLSKDPSFPPAGSDGRDYFHPEYEKGGESFGDTELVRRAQELVGMGTAQLALTGAESRELPR